MRRALIAVAVLVGAVCSSPVHAQITDVTNVTSTPIPGAGHDYIKALSETVSPSNGSVSLRIQVPTPPGRRLSLPFAFAYDSNGAHHLESTAMGNTLWWDNTAALSAGGWSYSVPVLSNMLIDIPGGLGPDCAYFNNYTFQDETGGRHSLYLTTGANTPTCLTDGIVNQLQGGDDYYHGVLTTNTNSTLPVTDAHGAIYTFPCCNLPYVGGGFNANSQAQSGLPSSIEDRNGNIVSIADHGTGAFTVTDTLGRTMLSSSGFGSSGNTVTVSGLGGAYTLTWGTASSNYSVGGSLVYNSGGNCGTAVIHSDVQTLKVITKLTLPNGTFYSFSYDPTYGVLSKITYPNGGYVSYAYSVSSLAEQAQFEDTLGKGTCIWHHGALTVAHRYVSFDGVNVALQQDFSYSTVWSTSYPYSWTSKSTTVTTTDNVSSQIYATSNTYSPILLARQPNDHTQFGAQVPVESSVVYKDTTGTTLRTVTKGWYSQFELMSQQTALENNQTSKTAYTYGPGAQVTEQDDYDYGTGVPGNLLRQTKMTYQSFTSPIGGTIYDRPCKIVTYDGSNHAMAETDYTYDGGTALCGTAGTPSVQDVSNLPTGTHDETNYSAGSTGSRGNVTTKTQSLSGGTSPVTTYTYDKTGQVLAVTEPCGNSTCSDMTGSTHTTNYSYADSYTTLSGGTNNPYTPSANTNAFITQITDPLSHTANFTYDFYGGDLTVSKDANSQSDTYIYNDSFARPTQMNYPDGGQTSFAYNDSTYNQTNNTPNVQLTKAIASGLNLTSTTAMDGLGHAVRTLLTSDPDGTDTTDTTYDGMARARTASNPHRSGSLPTDGTATHNFDPLGRVTSVVEQDGSTATTTYSGNCSTVTDEAGKSRQSCSDGLGRLTQVFEDPGSSPHLNYETDYTYDALNNLLTVNQKGGDSNAAHWRPRAFTYDSLSRLLTASNPESGSISYSYDADGNLASKTAPQPNQTGTATVTTNYVYDALSRLTAKSYVGMSTAAAYYGYDGNSLTGCPNDSPPSQTDSYPIGRRTSMCDGSGGTTWVHDKMGRILSERRSIAGVHGDYDTDVYNLDGSVGSVTSLGYQVTYTYNGAARPITAKNFADPFNFVTSATYAPFGGLTAASLGAKPITVSDSYNSRLQPSTLSSSTTAATIISLGYDFHASTHADNGNVYQIANNRDGNRTQNFLYDSLNRIQQAYTNGTNWGETFSSTATAPGVAPTTPGIDAWGNLTNRSGVTGKTLYEPLSVSAGTNNQLSGFGYDAAGNMTSNGGAGYVYDAENRLIATAGMSYIYDGDGVRVEKCTEGSTAGTCASGATGTMYWTGVGSAPLAETDLSGNVLENYVFFNGQRIARRDASTKAVHFYFSDHLGTHSLVTDANGTMPPQEESDFYPYGGEIVLTSGDTNHYKFTGKERDSESGNDYFGARYYASGIGRFMSPDWSTVPVPIPFADITNPRSLNLYAYVGNNPLSRFDSDGHVVVDRGIIYVPYAVTGATANEAEANANAHFGGQFAGKTTPTFNVSFTPKTSATTSGTNTTVTLTAPSDDKVTTTLSQTIELPTWKSSDPAEQAAFDKATAQLKTHEETHAADNRAVAEKLDKSIPGTSASATSTNPQNAVNAASTKLNTKVDDKVNAAVADATERAKTLDDTTGHGTKP